MKTSDLRQGNILQVDNNILIVTGINNNRIYFDEVSRYIANASPILITDDWLKLFGFEQNGWGFDIKFNDEDWYNCYIHWQDGVTTVSVGELVEIPHIIPFIKYVHQLQNIYHSFSNKDFPIDPIAFNSLIVKILNNN